MDIRLFNDDCFNILPSIAAKSVDMILCDLPYGATKNANDIPLPFDKLWQEYNRIIKDNGVIALFAQGLFYVDLVASNRKMFRYDLVWDKILTSGFLNAKRMPLRSHEQIAIFYKKLPIYNAQMSIGNPSHVKGTLYLTKTATNNNYGKYKVIPETSKYSSKKYPKSILTFSKPHPSVANHETEKPVELLKYLIKTYTNKNETVLDNCMGSGSTGVACVNTQRDFIGIEKNNTYFQIAQKRITKAKLIEGI